MDFRFKIILVLVAMCYSYYCGCVFTGDHYKAKLEKLKSDNAQKIIETERNYIIKRDKIERKYLEQLEIEKAENERIKSELKNAKYSNTVNVDSVCKQNTSGARMPTKTNNKSELICYTKSELQRKVAESLVIASECDKLVISYNSLLEQCKND